jgi:hypothetical protein
VEEVWFKGWCVFGKDYAHNQGVRAEWCVFRKTRRQWRCTGWIPIESERFSGASRHYVRCDR